MNEKQTISMEEYYRRIDESTAKEENKEMLRTGFINSGTLSVVFFCMTVSSIYEGLKQVSSSQSHGAAVAMSIIGVVATALAVRDTVKFQNSLREQK